MTPQHFLLAAIGNVCVQWAMLENLSARFIWLLLDLDEETGPIVTGGLDMLPRLNMAINLARHKKLPKPIINCLVSTRKALQDGISDRRNQIVHGIHRDGSSDLTVVLTMHRWSGPKRSQEIEVNAVRKLGTEICEIWKTFKTEALFPCAIEIAKRRAQDGKNDLGA